MHHLHGCSRARSDNVGQDVVSLSLTHTLSEQLSVQLFERRPHCAGLHGACVMWRNLNVCSYHSRDFISRVTDTRSLFLLVKFPLTRSTFLYTSHLLTAPFYIFTSYLLPPSALLFFLALPFPSLHEFPNCLHFLSPPSFFP